LRTFALSRRDHAANNEPNQEAAEAEGAPANGAAELTVLPQGCGHTRRLVAVAPASQPQVWPAEPVGDMAAPRDVVAANVRSPFLLYEADGLSLAHVAQKLVESRPDAAEAAHRLHIRNDVEWQKLPRVVVED
jgi:hypothetical protein